MKSTLFNEFRFLSLSITVYGLLFAGMPVSAVSQTSGVNRLPQHSNLKSLKTDAPSDNYKSGETGQDNARGGNGGGPRLTPTPSQTPTPTPSATPTPTPTPSAPSQWEIAARQGVKFYTNHSDWYRVSSQDLVSKGFDINTDISEWQLYSNGTEIPLKVNSDRSVEFYGIGTDRLETDSEVYYLIRGNYPGLRHVETQGGSAGPNADAVFFEASAENRDRISYVTRILNGEAKNWFGSFLNSTAVTLNVQTPELAAAGQASINVQIQGYNDIDHLITVRVNGYSAGTMSFTGKISYAETFQIPLSSLNAGVNNVTLQAVGSGADYNFVDSIEIKYPRNFRATGNRIQFKVPAGQTARIDGFTSPDIGIYKIENNSVLNSLASKTEILGGTFGFSLAANSEEREFIAISSNSISAPARIERNTPSFWNDSSNSATFLIISPSDFAAQAQSLADRRQSQGMSTKVVFTEDIGDEFDNGTVSAASIRRFLFHARNFWQRSPQFVLLFGDSSYDMRNYLGGPNRNFVPAKLIETFDMETSSDAWFTDFNDDGVEDIPTGRIPVGTTAEADRAIQKIVRYETQNLSEPRRAVLAADNYFEILNGALQGLLPNNASSQRLERSVLGDFEMRNQLLAGVNANPTVVTYLGHGTTTGWTTGQVMRSTDAASMTNQKLSFYMLMTCLNGFSHNLQHSSLAESVVMAENGAIAAWASSGSTYASGQIEMGQQVVTDLFRNGNKTMPIGEIVLGAKLRSNDWDARRTWQLFGDPTLTIK